MAVTPLLGITEVAPTQTDKVTTINDMVVALEAATQASLAVDMSGGDVTLSAAQFTGKVSFLCSGLTAAHTLTVPLSQRFFGVRNPSAYSLTVRAATGASVVIPSGTNAVLLCDGTDIVSFGGAAVSNKARNTSELMAQWVLGAVITNGTFYFAGKAPYAGSVNTLDAICATGSFTVAVQITHAGTTTPVTGLSAVPVTSSQTTVSATGANSFAAGDVISGVITLAANNPTGTLLNLNVTWS